MRLALDTSRTKFTKIAALMVYLRVICFIGKRILEQYAFELQQSKCCFTDLIFPVNI